MGSPLFRTLVPLRKVPLQLVRLWRAKLRRCCKPPNARTRTSAILASSCKGREVPWALSFSSWNLYAQGLVSYLCPPKQVSVTVSGVMSSESFGFEKHEIKLVNNLGHNTSNILKV